MRPQRALAPEGRYQTTGLHRRPGPDPESSDPSLFYRKRARVRLQRAPGPRGCGPHLIIQRNIMMWSTFNWALAHALHKRPNHRSTSLSLNRIMAFTGAPSCQTPSQRMNTSPCFCSLPSLFPGDVLKTGKSGFHDDEASMTMKGIESTYRNREGGAG